MKHLQKFESFMINENRLIVSYNVIDFLFHHNDLAISAILLELTKDPDATKDLNFLQPIGDDRVVFSNNSKYSDKDEWTFDWDNQDKKNPTTIGRFVRKILVDKNISFSDESLHEFTKHWHAYFVNKDEIVTRIVSGEEIRLYYDEKTYFDKSSYGGSTLQKSCMRYGDKQKYMDIYVKNPEVIRMVILTNKSGELLGRRLIFKTTSGDWVADRAYYTSDWQEIYLDNWCLKNLPRVTIQKPSEKDKYFTVKLKEWKFKYYPYVDNFKYLNYHTGELHNFNFHSSDPILFLDSLDGGYRQSSKWIYSKYLDEFISKEHSYFDRQKESYMPLKGINKAISKIKKGLMDIF